VEPFDLLPPKTSVAKRAMSNALPISVDDALKGAVALASRAFL
jgi:hypothetical protein